MNTVASKKYLESGGHNVTRMRSSIFWRRNAVMATDSVCTGNCHRWASPFESSAPKLYFVWRQAENGLKPRAVFKISERQNVDLFYSLPFNLLISLWHSCLQWYRVTSLLIKRRWAEHWTETLALLLALQEGMSMPVNAEVYFLHSLLFVDDGNTNGRQNLDCIPFALLACQESINVDSNVCKYLQVQASNLASSRDNMAGELCSELHETQNSELHIQDTK